MEYEYNVLEQSDKDKVLGEIYKITHIHNGKSYIGQTRTHRLNHDKYRPFGYKRRFDDHKSVAMCNNKPKQCTAINNAIREDSIDVFEVELIERCSIDELDEKEQYYIKHFKTLFPEGYNLTNGGNKNFQTLHTDMSHNSDEHVYINNYKHSQDTLKKMSENSKKYFNSDSYDKEKKQNKTREQHLKQRMKIFENCSIDLDNLDSYIHSVISKETGCIKQYKVTIDEKTTRFHCTNKTPEETYDDVITFLKTLNIDKVKTT